MNFYELIKNALVSFAFGSLENYNIVIGNNEELQQIIISLMVDLVSFIIPFTVLLFIFVIPMYFILKAFNKVIKTMRGNVYVEEEREPRHKRKK